jgi:MoaA/NifB/PqqE/SkfB family radical SAM enzyme
MRVTSPDYNFVFDEKTGFFARWGKTLADDPQRSPFGPEILDIEVSTICSKGCAFCYKSNKQAGVNMSFGKFKHIFDYRPPTITQIAFGIGDIDANPDLFKMFSYCRLHHVVPNVTINGERMTPQLYDSLSRLCGAVAVSHYSDDSCFNAVQELAKRGMKQVNIHALLSEETYQKCTDLINSTDPRLAGLNAVVFLWLKPKGNRNNLHQLSSLDKFKTLINLALDNGERIGFDSCSANNFMKAIADRPDAKELSVSCEPCESGLFSYYINAHGVAYPCSFSEGLVNGIDLMETSLKDAWKDKITTDFANKLQSCNRSCPLYKLELDA